jgi:bifunctional non-homologous end joining protein LigD
MTESVAAGSRRVPITHADRVLFPAVGLTKLDLARYYACVGAAMIPLVRGRPLALQVFPDGVQGDGYFLKNAPRHFPAWLTTVTIARREGGTIHQVLANNAATLVYLAGQNAITPHVWTSRADRLEQPDRMIFDLDPSTNRFAEVRAAARALGNLLRDLGLVPFAMTTGSRGLHVLVPVRRTETYAVVHRLANDLAARFAEHDPKRLTVEFRRDRRGERIFVDVGRNAYGQHAVAPYAVRALANAPVATPLHWEELDERRLDPQRWTVANIAERLELDGDPWRGLARHARALPRVLPGA